MKLQPVSPANRRVYPYLLHVKGPWMLRHCVSSGVLKQLLISPSPGGLEERLGRPPQERVNRQLWDGKDMEVKMEGRGAAQEPGEGGLDKGRGCLPYCPHQSFHTKTQNSHFHALPCPSPHRANMALQRGAQSSVELLQWLAWGLGPQRNLCFPSLPTHPSQNLTPSPTRPGSVV